MRIILLVITMASGNSEPVKERHEMPSIEMCMAEADRILMSGKKKIDMDITIVGAGCYMEFQRDATLR